MNLRKWILTLLIALPIAVILLNHLWIQRFLKPPLPIQQTARVLIPPFEMLVRYFDFNEKNALREWGEKMFRGRVIYQLEFENRDGFIHSKSTQSASAIFHRIKFDVRNYPYLQWKWRVGKFPNKGAAQTPKSQDDFAARVYVIFASRFFQNFRCVEYVWDETLLEGTALNSPYSNQIKQLVVQSGPSQLNQWTTERQHVLEDYEKLFGKKPDMKVSAIAIMTDSEGTETEAEGFFDDIQIGKPRELKP